MSKLLVQSLLLVAKKSGNATAFLENIIVGNFETHIENNGRVVVSTVIGGNSVSWSSMSGGFSPSQLIQLAQLALNYHTTGQTPTNRTKSRFQ